MKTGRVLFVGCGPGAADLLTLRAVRALAAADIVIWNATLLDRHAIADHARADAEIVEWPPATQEDILAAFDRAHADDLLVVRLKGGDPTLFGELEPELSAARDRGIACEIVPGISALSAAAAALALEVATPHDPLLLAGGRAPFGDARSPTRIAVYGVGGDPRGLEASLLARGLPSTTPCAVALEVSRRDETIIACALEDLAETLEDAGRGVLALVLVGAG